MSARDWDPDWTMRPGVYLKEWCEEKKVTQRELARRLGVSEKHISQIVHGHARYSLPFALKLAEETGIPRGFWWTLQCNHLLDLALGRKDVSDQ